MAFDGVSEVFFLWADFNGNFQCDPCEFPKFPTFPTFRNFTAKRERNKNQHIRVSWGENIAPSDYISCVDARRYTLRKKKRTQKIFFLFFFALTKWSTTTIFQPWVKTMVSYGYFGSWLVTKAGEITLFSGGVLLRALPWNKDFPDQTQPIRKRERNLPSSGYKGLFDNHGDLKREDSVRTSAK